VLVNGDRVNIPSYITRPGDIIEIAESSRDMPALLASLESAGGRALPAWLSLDAANFKGTVLSVPLRDEIDTDVQESLIVEYYSR